MKSCVELLASVPICPIRFVMCCTRHVSHEVASLAVYLALDKMRVGNLQNFFLFAPNSALGAMHFTVTFLADEFRDSLTAAADERIGSLCRHQATS